MKNIYTSLCIVLFSTSLLCCGDIAKDHKFMNKLREDLQKKYPNQKIEMMITNGTELSVSFINSSFNDSSSKAKERITCEISALVSTPTNDNPNFETGEVIFINKHDYIIANSSNSQKYSMCFQNCAECDEIK